MKKQIIIGVITSISFYFLIVSCTDEVDTQAPVIEVSSPKEEAHFHPGDTLYFVGQFNDNVALKSYKINIHFNADGHEHKSTKDFSSNNAWTFEKSWLFEPGKTEEQVSHKEIIIPETIDGLPLSAGDYHFGVFCSDESGNESHHYIDIEIEN
jgi:hypothetical protein